MFAVFGDITLQVLDSPESMEITHEWDYAEHKVVEARPLLQWLSNALDEITLSFGLQTAWTDPAAQLNALITMADQHLANPLAFGNGRLLGWFVIIKLIETSRQLAADGSPIAIELKLTLKEYVREVDPTAPPVPATPPLGIAQPILQPPLPDIGGQPVLQPLPDIGGQPALQPIAPTAGVSALLATARPPLVAPGTAVGSLSASTIVRAP